MREFEEVITSSTGTSVKEVCGFCPVILGIDVYIEGGYTECYKIER